MRSRFYDLIPEQHLDLMGLSDSPAKTAALEQAYDDGFVGCFTPDMSGPLGASARWYEDEFKDVAGKDAYLWEHYHNPDAIMQDVVGSDTEFGHIASKPAFETWNRDKDPQAVDWLFGIFQNFGNCVDASLVELLHGILGIRAADPTNNEVFRWLMAFYAYVFRGYCSHGWYIPTAASVSVQYGYCFALPSIAGVKYLEENDSEYAVSREWCNRGRPPEDFQQHVNAQGWRFGQGAITKFSGGTEALKDVIRLKGQVHHGSNYTSGGSKPGQLKRIGGHAQTLLGGDWSERTLKFFRDKNVSYTESNFPVVNHQTWGGSWSGAVSSSYWPEWWGPRPQGAWVCSAQQAVDYLFRSAYVYLPMLKGTPGTGPSPPLQADNGSPIRGELIAKSGDKESKYIIVPDGQGGYVPAYNPF